METQLTTLAATLQSISSLHAATLHNPDPRLQHRPFTSAILNSFRLDIVDYIRDADALEAKLFWYPPSAPGGGSAATTTSSNRIDDGARSNPRPAAASTAPGSSHSATSSTATNSSKRPRPSVEAAAADAAANASLLPRVPEPRQFVPPTPLRGPTHAAAAGRGGGSGSTNLQGAALAASRYDARTLLVAAQKLCDNYHHGPRARKHVRALLKRSSDMNAEHARAAREIALLERDVARLSALPVLPAGSKLGGGAGSDVTSTGGRGAAAAKTRPAAAGKPNSAADSAQTHYPHSHHSSRLKEIDEEKFKAEMDVVALEHIIAELEARLAKAAGGRADATGGNDTTAAVGEERREDEAEEDTLEAEGDADADDATVKLVGSAASRADVDGADGARDGDATVPGATGLAAVEAEADKADGAGDGGGGGGDDVEGMPQPTDELERIAENVWSAFGDSLRWACADGAAAAEGAEFVETLRLLERLQVCAGPRGVRAAGGAGGAGGLGVGAEDVSVSDAGSSVAGSAVTASSGATSSSSSSTRSAASCSPPTVQTLLSAHTLSVLLRSPAPHSRDLNSLKAEGERWWSSEGGVAWREYRRHMRGAAVGGGAEEGEANAETQTSKAVYDLIAKRLLRVKHQAGVRVISFS